jgi:antitoxin HigA-1
MSRMHNPPHPGEIIKELCLEPLGLSVTDAAKGLGVTRKALSELINGHSGISRKWRSGWNRRSEVPPKPG